MEAPFFLTEVAQDWDNLNLSVAQQILKEVEEAVSRRSNPTDDPMLDSPNLRVYRGFLRWVLAQKFFETAVSRNRFNGISAVWVEAGGISMLELRGKYTAVIPCHLYSEDEHPREADYQKDRRIQNQVNPLLHGLEVGEPTAQDGLLNLLLVYGGSGVEFAYLRAYVDQENRFLYRRLSENIMRMPVLLPSLEAELVAEPEPKLKDAPPEQKTAETEE
jgi:hypothetical protein